MIWVALAAGVAAGAPTRYEACGGAHTETSKRYVGFASEATGEVASLQRALADARSKALADLCGGGSQSDGVCEALSQYVFDGSDFPKAKRSAAGTWSTCAWVDVREEGFDAVQKARVKVAADVARVADAILQTTSESDAGSAAGIFLAAPTWAGGCDAGQTGASLQQMLRDALAHLGKPLRGRRAEATHVVEVSLQLGANGTLLVQPHVMHTDGTHVVEPAGLTVPRGFFTIDPSAATQCRVWSQMGLSDAARSGSTGLSVDLSLDAKDHDLCAGETFTADVSVRGLAPGAREPELVLVSVEADGDAVIVKRARGTSLRSGNASLPDLAETQEAMIAIAVPDGVTFHPEWVQDCLLPRQTFNADRLPVEAAWAQVTYTLRDTGSGQCVNVDPKLDAQRKQLAEIVAHLQVCGGLR